MGVLDFRGRISNAEKKRNLFFNGRRGGDAERDAGKALFPP